MQITKAEGRKEQEGDSQLTAVQQSKGNSEMFDKSVALNIKIALNEFSIGLGLSVFCLFLVGMGGTLMFIVTLAVFLAAFVFFVMGFIKLFYKSLFSGDAYLYMSLPISNLQVILSKVLVGTFWLSLWSAVLLGSSAFYLSQSGNFFDLFMSYLLMEGIPSDKVGPLMVLTFWSGLLNLALFSATLLFSIILTNTLGIRWFKAAVDFFVLILVFAAGVGILYAMNKVLEHFFDAVSDALQMVLFSLIGALVLLFLLVFFSEKLLTRRYNLN